MDKFFEENQILSYTRVHYNKCQCGWWFPALSPHIKKCPQCKDEQRLCLECGVAISGHHHKRFCNNCAKERINILQKYKKRDRVENEKYKFSDRNNNERLCDYNCFECKFSECLLPIDKEDMETMKLFEDEK